MSGSIYGLRLRRLRDLIYGQDEKGLDGVQTSTYGREKSDYFRVQVQGSNRVFWVLGYVSGVLGDESEKGADKLYGREIMV